MHDHDGAGAVRMSVALGWLSVSRPARVTNPDMPSNRLSLETALQRGQLALGASDLEPTLAHHGDTRRIVAAVLESPQPR